MKWLLDTNACIRYLNGRSDSLRKRLHAADPAQVAVCSVVKAELFFGAMRSRNPDAALAAQKLFLTLRLVRF